jgi:shikimate dehydrogenase
MVTALRQAGVTSGGNALILGGGATACSALAALRDLGAVEVDVAVRSRPRAEPLRTVAARLGLAVRLVDLDADLGLADPESADAHAGAGPLRWDVLISTIPVPAAVAVARQIASGEVHADAVFDVGYDPWPTLLAEAAQSAGLAVISGYELLVHQAVVQFELMTGRAAPVAAMRAGGLAELARRRNNR